MKTQIQTQTHINTNTNNTVKIRSDNHSLSIQSHQTHLHQDRLHQIRNHGVILIRDVRKSTRQEIQNTHYLLKLLK